jgi:hypothetical protein
MNPSKMRDTYGKMMYILMDTESFSIKSELKLSFVKPILTVSAFLDDRKSLNILSDPLWETATRSIANYGREKSHKELATEAGAKAQAEATLRKKYKSGMKTLLLCLLIPCASPQRCVPDASTFCANCGCNVS